MEGLKESKKKRERNLARIKDFKNKYSWEDTATIKKNILPPFTAL